MVPAKTFRQPEARLRATRRDVAAMPVKDVQQLVHELQVHQIELEMQNEELRRAQMELEAARDRYVDLYDFSPAGHLTLDTHGTIVEANLRAGTLFGINRKELIGRPLAHFIARDDQDIFHRHCQEVLKTGTRQICEVQVRKKAGASSWVYLESLAVHNEPGHVTHWRTALLDITARKRVEEALRRSEERFRTMFAQAPIGIARIDSLTGQIHEVNSTYAQIVGRTAEEMRSLDWMHISHPDDVQADLDNMARLNAGEIAGFQMEKRLVRPDGTVVWINLTVAPIQIEEQAGSHHLAMIEDIADRKQAEEAMREGEQRFHTMADTAPVLIWMAGPDKLRIYFNQVWLDYTGRTREQELGYGWMDGVHPEDFDRCLKTYGEAFDRREPFQMEYRLRRADGQYGWILVHAVPRLQPNGEFAGYIGSCIDLTERKDLEDRLRKAVKEKEILLREVHHRVKNNLQVISSVLNLQAASIKDPRVVQLFRESQIRITSIALLHETLHRSNDLSCIRMSNYLRTLASHVFRSYGIDHKAIVLDLLVEDLAFDIDTAMTCGMIVEELLSNSLKHAYAVGKEGRIQIELRAQDEGAYLLQVSDDGVGMSKDGVRRNPGSLGLELVNLLAGKLDGTVELQSGPGTAWRIAFHQSHYQERM
ncbi:MAG: PAS domain S-box protein [Nitrospiraceae bacterium]|nr:PAS domain S-box protein [Nitrospiraceae bacterium]